jgi:20S proteasome alpha/beta subunit
MWGYIWELGSTDMTAIVAVKARDGIVIHSDSLAMNLELIEDKDIVVNFIDRIGKHRQKVFKISPHTVICFTGNNFPLELMKPMSNAMKDAIKDRQLRELSEIAKVAKGIIRRELKKGQEIQALIAGYNLDKTGSPKNYSLLHIGKDYAIKEVKENYFALGAGQLISYTVKKANHTVPLFNDVEAANKQADKFMEYLSKLEKQEIEMGNNDWHIGGNVKRFYITPEGVVNKPVTRKLPIRVAVGQIFNLTVKD